MKKALYVATVFIHLNTFHVPFMKMLQDKGYEVWAVAASSDIESKKNLEDMGIKCLEIPFSRSPFDFSNVKAYKTLKQLFRTEYFDLIHFHTPIAAFIGRMAAKNTDQGSIIYTAHGFHFYKGAPLKNWIIYYLLEKMASKLTDAIITINKEDYEFAKKHFQSKRTSVYYVHGVGIDLTKFDLSAQNVRTEYRKKFSFDPEDFIIISIGELNKNKNHIQLIRAMKIIEDPKIKCIIAGDGILKKELEEEIVKNKMENKIFLLGYRKDIIQLLFMSDLLVSCSIREGLPKNVMEAMACGLPVIAANNRGHRDLIHNEENGMLIKIGDSIGLKQSIEKLKNSKELRLKMGEENLKIIKNFSLKIAISEIEKIYQIVSKCKMTIV